MSGPTRARLLLKNAKQIVTVGGGSGPKLGRAMGQVRQKLQQPVHCGLESLFSAWHQ